MHVYCQPQPYCDDLARAQFLSPSPKRSSALSIHAMKIKTDL